MFWVLLLLRIIALVMLVAAYRVALPQIAIRFMDWTFYFVVSADLQRSINAYRSGFTKQQHQPLQEMPLRWNDWH